MDEYRFYRALHEERPYFGPRMAAPQGDPRRKAQLQALVAYVAQQWPSSPIDIIEIGSWAGASTIAWAKALDQHAREGRVVCVDHWRTYLDTTINVEPIYQAMDASVADDAIHRLFRHNLHASGVTDRVIEMRGSSRDVLPRLAPESFQIVFIDGSHAYEDVLSDIRHGMRLVCDGVVICGDDLEIQADDCDPGFLKRASSEARDYCQDPKTGLSFHPGVTRAVHETFGAVTALDGLWLARKAGAAWTGVCLDSTAIGVPEHLSLDCDEPRVESLPGITAGDYNLHRVGERILAVWQGLGEIDLLHEPVGVREWPPFLLIGDDVEELTARAAALTKARRSPQIELLGEVDGYNLLRVDDKTYGLAQTLGPVALLGERLGEREMPPGLVIGDSVGEVTARIRSLVAREADARAAVVRIAQLEEELRSVSGSAARSEAALRDTEDRLRASAERAALWERRAEDLAGELRIVQKRLTAVAADLERAAMERRRLLEEIDRLRIDHQGLKDENARLDQERSQLTETLASKEDELQSKQDELREMQRFVDEVMAEVVELKDTWWYRWMARRTLTEKS
jgi:predicted O-methyltransferase YrrM